MRGLKQAVLGAAVALAGGAAAADGIDDVTVANNYLRWAGAPQGFYRACPIPFVIGPGVECSFIDAGTTFTADFTGTQLIIDQYINDGYKSVAWNFEVSQLPGQHLYFQSATLVSSDFPDLVVSAGVGGLTTRFVGPNPSNPASAMSNILIAFGGTVDGNHHYHAVWDLTVAPVPEPGTYALMLAGVGLLAARRRLSRDARADR